MAADPDADVVTYLASQSPVGGVSLTAGTNLFRGPVRPANEAEAGAATIPAQAVFCLATGGPAPQPYMSPAGQNFYQSRVQVRIRSNPGDYDNGKALARGCRGSLHQAMPSGYIAIFAEESEPNYLAQDDQGCHEWSVNLTLWWQG